MDRSTSNLSDSFIAGIYSGRDNLELLIGICCSTSVCARETELLRNELSIVHFATHICNLRDAKNFQPECTRSAN